MMDVSILPSAFMSLVSTSCHVLPRLFETATSSKAFLDSWKFAHDSLFLFFLFLLSHNLLGDNSYDTTNLKYSVNGITIRNRVCRSRENSCVVLLYLS